MNKRFLIAIAAALLLGGLAFFFTREKPAPSDSQASQSDAPLPVQTASVAERQSASFSFSYPGTVSSEGEARLTAQVSGTIVSATLALNRYVGAGQTLYTIDETGGSLGSKNGTRSADLQSAAFALENAKKAYQEAVRNDHQQGTSASESAKIQARNSRDLAEVAYVSLRDKHFVKSPIAGTVTIKNASVGDIVSAGTPLATVSRGKQIVRFFVNDAERMLLTPGQEVSLSKDAAGQDAVSGKLLRVSQAADPESRRFLAEAESPDPRFKSFATGSVVTVSATVTRSAPTGSFFLPLSAVLRDQSGAAVLASVDGQAKRLPVEIRNIDGETVELSGLSDTATRIIMTDVKRLKEGDAVALK
jgi:membrane fusion protein (multidrug efflux system)